MISTCINKVDLNLNQQHLWVLSRQYFLPSQVSTLIHSLQFVRGRQGHKAIRPLFVKALPLPSRFRGMIKFFPLSSGHFGCLFLIETFVSKPSSFPFLSSLFLPNLSPRYLKDDLTIFNHSFTLSFDTFNLSSRFETKSHSTLESSKAKVSFSFLSSRETIRIRWYSNYHHHFFESKWNEISRSRSLISYGRYFTSDLVGCL